MEICKLENIRKDYFMGEPVTPINGLSLTVNAGDLIAVEGPSGIGKSTLLYILGLLLQSDGGSHVFEGRAVSALSDKEKSALRAQKIGFLFQDATLIQALTLRENLLFSCHIGGKTAVCRKRVDELLHRFGLEDRADFLPHQLSGGQRRRVMAARCLIHRPILILADEPTNDLDEHWSVEIMRALQEEAQRGAGVVMVTHNSRWAKLAENRYDLHDGMLTHVTNKENEKQ
ncbi:MAG: ABC transporter ATP-binding protein [Clostridia bacterium]|nr:ABC transporter ATP-binding protein [Clostridia bacterium]